MKFTRIISILFLIAIFVTVMSIMIHGYTIKHDIDNNGELTIGKYVDQDDWGKGETNSFIYYVKGKKQRGNGGRAPQGFKENLGKFYRIQFSKKYENSLKAFFDQEIKDTSQILKAGFSKSELGWRK